MIFFMARTPTVDINLCQVYTTGSIEVGTQVWQVKATLVEGCVLLAGIQRLGTCFALES